MGPSPPPPSNPLLLTLHNILADKLLLCHFMLTRFIKVYIVEFVEKIIVLTFRIIVSKGTAEIVEYINTFYKHLGVLIYHPIKMTG